MKHMVRGFVCLAIAAGVSLAALAEEPEESQLQLGLSFFDLEAVVTVPASESRVPMKVRIAWGEGKGIDVATVTATGGVFRVDARKMPILPGTKVHAELVSAYDVVEYVESHGTEYVDVGTTLVAGIKVSMDAQFTSAEVTQTAWGFSAGRGCWLGNASNSENYCFANLPFDRTSVLNRVLSSVYYETLAKVHLVIGSVGGDRSGPGSTPGDGLKIFASGANPSYWTPMKLWAFTVENVAKGETLVDFIPVRKDGVGALYDVEHGVLYEANIKEESEGGLSCGGGTVIPGGACLGVSNEATFESVCVATASEENLVADGEPHQGSVNVIYPADGYEVKWAWSNDLTSFVHDEPEPFTEIGEHRNAVRVTCAGYRPWQGESVIRIFAAGSHRAVSARRVSNHDFVIAWGPHFERTDVYIVWDDEDHPDAESPADWPNSRLALSLTDASKPGEAKFKCPDGARVVRVVVVKNRMDIGVDAYLEWIKWNGAQVLDLGYVPSVNTGVEIDMQMADETGSGAMAIFGTFDGPKANYGSAVGTQWMIWYYGNGLYRTYFRSVYLDVSKQINVPSADKASKGTMAYSPDSGLFSFTYDGGFVSKNIGKNSVAPTTHLALFGIICQDGVQYPSNARAKLQVYELRIYESGELVRQFRPAVKDGEALMVDVLDPTRLAVNVGDNANFICGKDVTPIGQTVRKFDFSEPFGLMILLK